jgi:hypothetical protein
MANSWLRLWHDMPNDPKWRTVARLSGEPISLVLAIYTHLLVDASRNVTRGHVTVTPEDLASALDVTEAQIEAVLASMEGRVIADGYLSGWENRQVKREDQGDEESGVKSAAQRKKEQREREKQAKEAAEDQAKKAAGHAMSRNVTLDKDKDKDKEKNTGESAKRATKKCPDDFLITEAMQEWAATECPGVATEAATRKFRDYTFKTAMTDWAATWRNWIRSDYERLPKATSGETAYQRSMREKMERDFPNLTNKGQHHGSAALLG